MRSSITFACDGVSGCTAEVAGLVGSVAVLRGTGTDAGRWFTRGSFGARSFRAEDEARALAAYYAQDAGSVCRECGRPAVFRCRRDGFTWCAQHYPESECGAEHDEGAVRIAGDADAAPEFHATEVTPERNQRARLDQLEKRYDLGGLGPEELAEYRHLRELVSSDDDPDLALSNRGVDVSVSAAQHRAMGAAAGGKSNLGIPKKVGEEFMRADKGKSFDDEYSDFERDHPQTSRPDKHGAFRPVEQKPAGPGRAARFERAAGWGSSEPRGPAPLPRRPRGDAENETDRREPTREEVQEAYRHLAGRGANRSSGHAQVKGRSGYSRADLEGMSDSAMDAAPREKLAAAAQRAAMLERGVLCR